MVKEILVKASANPQTQVLCANAIGHLSTTDFSNLYDRFIDHIAYKIAAHLYELEKKEKE